MNQVCEQADMMGYERWIDRMVRLCFYLGEVAFIPEALQKHLSKLVWASAALALIVFLMPIFFTDMSWDIAIVIGGVLLIPLLLEMVWGVFLAAFVVCIAPCVLMDRLLAKDVELRLWALENHLLIMAGMAALLLPFMWYCFS